MKYSAFVASALFALYAAVPVSAAGFDLNADTVVNGEDLAIVLGSWGPCAEECVADVNGDGEVNGVDVEMVQKNWTVAVTGSVSKADLNKDGIVGDKDLAMLLGGWGNCESQSALNSCIGDLNGDGAVDDTDLNLLMSRWSDKKAPAFTPTQKAKLRAVTSNLRKEPNTSTGVSSTRGEQIRNDMRDNRPFMARNIIVATILNRYTLAIERLETLALRLETRADSLAATGVDTTGAVEKLSDAREELAAARATLGSVMKLESSGGDLSFNAELRAELRGLLADIKAHLEESRKSLLDAVKLLKSAS